MVDDTIFQKLLDVGFRLVSFRPRSKKEFVDALQTACKKRHIEDVSIIDTVLTRLTELGYVDDEKFTKWWIDQRNQFRLKGWRALSFELQQKGIDRNLIQMIHQELESNDASQEEINATALVQKALVKFQNVSFKEQKMKLYSYLQRRGFESSVISRVVDAMGKKGYNTSTS
ncbi:MAG: RecX family transcriptional regulator [Patescibacteria group bacterium]